MAVLLDTSAILAAADTDDLNHRAAVAWFARVDEPLLVGALTLAEADHVLQRELGQAATTALVRSVVGGSVGLVAPTEDDLERALELMAEAAEHRPRLAEAVLVASAERLRIRRIATFDRRPIAVFRPRHVRAFDLEP
jgi:predicted nucleic acid-binding protein